MYVHVTWSEWQNLEPEERATAIAHYRMHHLIEMHANHAAEKASERARAKRPPSRGRR